jgi:hypothetical protein
VTHVFKVPAAALHMHIAVLGRGRVPSLNGFKDAVAVNVENLGDAHKDPLGDLHIFHPRCEQPLRQITLPGYTCSPAAVDDICMFG